MSPGVVGVPEVRRCVFRNNVATQRGGGAYFAYHQNAIVEDCQFTGNRTNATGTGLEGGAGLYMSLNAVCVVRNNRIHNNSSGGNGGGIKFFNVTDVHLVNNTIVDNGNGAIAGFANTGAFGCMGSGSANAICPGGNVPPVIDYIEEVGSPAGLLSPGQHDVTLASTFCIPSVGGALGFLINGAANLPGPGATSLPGTLELLGD
jgi:hypothetical protein